MKVRRVRETHQSKTAENVRTEAMSPARPGDDYARSYTTSQQAIECPRLARGIVTLAATVGSEKREAPLGNPGGIQVGRARLCSEKRNDPPGEPGAFRDFFSGLQSTHCDERQAPADRAARRFGAFHAPYAALLYVVMFAATLAHGETLWVRADQATARSGPVGLGSELGIVEEGVLGDFLGFCFVCFSGYEGVWVFCEDFEKCVDYGLV